jgi:hypothetical protein
MFSDISAIREELKARIAPELPDGWVVKEYLTEAIESLTPVVYFEFVRFDSKADGQPLGKGYAGAEFNIWITDPKTDDKGSEDAVDTHVVRIINIIDSHSDIYWESAEKDRLKTGPLAWSIKAFAITNITPNTDPAPEE